uniref:Arp2/3 complex 34 kDa subunit n=1 Tax=Heterorhabditis bacteriophora TaxID=37862 RepID=A0A1I7WAF3_HETBA
MKIHRRLDEINLKRKCTRSLHVEGMLHNQLNDIQKSSGIIQDIQKRIPRLREPGLLFSSIFVHIYINSPHLDEVTSDEFHHTLLPACSKLKNIKKDEIHGIPIVFEYNLNIDDRKVSMDKVTFILRDLIFVIANESNNHCVFRHFGIPETSQKPKPKSSPIPESTFVYFIVTLKF